jgi:hypothetical protein
MRGSLLSRIKPAAVVLAAAMMGGLVLAPPANAAEQAGCGGGGFCVDYSVFGDASYTELALTGSFEGDARAELEWLRLCDERSDQTRASGTITIAERRTSDGAVSYRQYPNQEFVWGPKAGCRYIDPPDYTPVSGKYLWAIRADYSYNLPGGFGPAARAQTYHTAWAYNWYLRDWCPRC